VLIPPVREPPYITKPVAQGVHFPEVKDMTDINTDTDITIRRLGDNDAGALARLAELDSSRVPMGPVLGAEVGERLMAAISIANGRVLADPFSPTAELQGLLKVRVAQLNGKGRRPRRRRMRQRSRASLAGSPPGAGGKLLTLPVRLS
jgi:hypothetical protein